jgi:hypothetical protein
MAKIDPRNGAPKKLAPLNIHSGQYHFTGNGILIRALSKTQAAVLDGGLSVDTLTKGTIEKRFYDGEPAAHPSHTVLPPTFGRAQHNPGEGAAVLNDAANHPINRIRDIAAPGAIKSRT